MHQKQRTTFTTHSVRSSFTVYLCAVLLLTTPSAAANICAISNSEAFEHEGVIRFTIERCVPFGSTDNGETIPFQTENGSAVAGRDFVFTRETIRFGPGQTVAYVGVPLIDNGLADGDRSFSLVTEPTLRFFLWDECPHEAGAASIRDDEQAPTRLDLSFKPGGSPYESFVSELPDGRILISGGPRGIAVLKPDGAVDPSFYPDPNWAEFQPLQVLPNGQVLAYATDCNVNCGSVVSGLIKLSASGRTERFIRLPSPGDSSTQFVAAQPDGKLLFLSTSVSSPSIGLLRRFNADGSPDPSFSGPRIEENHFGIPAHRNVQIRADGKILIARTVVLEGGSKRGPLVRLEANGALDVAFAPTFNNASDVRGLPLLMTTTLTRNGGIVVGGDFTSINGIERHGLARLHADGTLDLSFNPPELEGPPTHGPIVEQPDGKLVLWRPPPFPSPNRSSFLMRLNEDGSIDPTFKVNVHRTSACMGSPPYALAVTRARHLLFASYFDSIDGLPCSGFVRLLDPLPHPELLVTALTFDWENHPVARIPIIRTGTVTNGASLSFRTVDGTAMADIDYIPRAGKLLFPPMVKESFVEVPLLQSDRTQSRSFILELLHPANPTNPAAFAIELLPELRIAGLWYRAHNVVIELEGTAPGADYALESSSDLKTWTADNVAQATRSTMLLEAEPAASGATRFFRARQR